MASTGSGTLVAGHELGGVVPGVGADGVCDVLCPVLNRALAGHDCLHRSTTSALLCWLRGIYALPAGTIACLDNTAQMCYDHSNV